MTEESDNGFTAFICHTCHQEIEAPAEIAGQTVECPACGAQLVVPAPGEGPTQAQLDAVKSRTIRIELGDL